MKPALLVRAVNKQGSETITTLVEDAVPAHIGYLQSLGNIDKIQVFVERDLYQKRVVWDKENS